MKTKLQYEDAKSRKFWEIELKGATHVVRYGSMGTAGRSNTKSFPSPAEARRDYDRLIQSKLKKGYKPTGAVQNSPTTKSQPKMKPAADGMPTKSAIVDALRAVRENPSPCVKMLLKQNRAKGVGFSKVTFKDFRTRLNGLPENPDILEYFSDDRRVESDDPLHSWDYRNMLEAEIIKGLLKKSKENKHEHAKILKLKDKTRIVRGDLHVKELHLENLGFLIVTGSLFVAGRLAFPGENCRLLVLGNLKVEHDVVSWSTRSTMLVGGNLHIGGIFLSAMNTLTAGNFEAVLLSCSYQGTIYTAKEFNVKILIGYDEHGVYVHERSQCEYVFPDDWPPIQGPPAAQVKPTPLKKLVPFVRKFFKWELLKGEADDFIYHEDDYFQYEELAEALEEYLEKARNRGSDLFRKIR